MTKEIDKVEQQDTIQHSFVPTAKMMDYLDASIRLISTSPTRISKESGIDRTAWYKWLKQDGFEDWFVTEYKKKRRRIMTRLDSIGMRKASTDYNYWRDMNRKINDLPESGGTNVQISGDDMKVAFISYED